MRAAAGRDMIAAEYASGFASVLAGAQSYAADIARDAPPQDALAVLFLRALATRPDTHIIRKHGNELAARVMSKAAAVLSALKLNDAASISMPQIQAQLVELDSELKSWGANPGSLADLMCATAFAADLIAATSALRRH
jgi:triphosphoribosyl-dephospho-CoA synthase